MDLDPTWIFIILFVLLPLIQRILEGARGGPNRRPGQPPTRPRVPPPPPRQTQAPQPRPDSGADQEPPERAADLIPADLWEILTGERRLPPPAPPQPARHRAPAPVQEADIDEELSEDEEARPARVEPDEDAAATELLRRREHATARAREVRREPEQIISLETELLPEPLRHAAFHDQLKKAAAAAVIVPPVRSRRVILSLENRSDLMRAIILHEVLGRPKGLE